MSSENVVKERSKNGRFLRYSEQIGRGAYKDVYKGFDTMEGKVIAWNSVSIVSFSEKDTLIDGLYESSGIYIMNQSAINVIPLNEEFSIEEDFFAKKVFKKFIGYVSMSKAFDIGTKERFTQAQTALSLT